MQILELGPRDWILLFSVMVCPVLVIFDILELPGFQKMSQIQKNVPNLKNVSMWSIKDDLD